MRVLNAGKTGIAGKGAEVLARPLFALALLGLLGAAPLYAATFTVTKTADTNDGVCNADCSLREAIGAANANASPDLIAFNIPPADPGFNAGTGVFTIAPGSALPAFTDPSTTIDGTTQTANVGNTNPTVHGAGGFVGVVPVPLAQVNGPEIEIRGQATIAAGLRVSADNTIIRGLAIYGFGNALGEADIVVDNGVDGGLFEFNLLGSQAHTFTDPGSGSRSRAGFASNGGDNFQLTNNLIGFGQARGAFIVNVSQGWLVNENEFRDNGLDDIGGDNIALDNDSIGALQDNLIAGAASQGLVITNTDTQNVNNNTFIGNGVGHVDAAPIQSGALTLRSTADDAVIRRNIFEANYGPGVMINSGSLSTRIDRNSFFDNGTIVSRNGSAPTNQVGIDLQGPSDDQDLGTPPYYNLNDDGDGDSGGNNINNFAVIESAQIVGPNLVISGFATANAQLQFYLTDGDPGNYAEGKTFLFTDSESGGNDTDGTTGSYGPGPVNGVVQGTETNVPRFRFTVALLSLPVPVTTADEIIATATLASETSEFGARAPVYAGLISGTVFVDIVGDGLADGPIGPAPNPFESGARIELWLDGGDNVPDGGDDTYQAFTTSALADGAYEFTGLANGTYWVTVDSGGVDRGPYNAGYSGADAWAEQTYGPAGAATYDGVSWSFAPAAGALYGGARWDVSDNFPPTNSLPGAEHIARVVVNNDDTTDVDFGFSFNVVTTTRGGDATVDPGTPPGQRSVQGSLRQFLTNANTEVGANAMRFVPAAPMNGADAGNTWWRIDVTTLLPIITDVNTTVDGLAYAVDGLTVVDPNDANIGAGETVGVDGLFTTPVLDPELELEVSGIDYGLQIDAATTVVRNVSIWKSNENDLRVGYNAGAPFTGTLIEQNVIGTPPYRFDASFQPTGNDLIDVFDDADSGTLQNNLIGFSDGGGFSPELGATSWLVLQNEIRGVGRAAGWGPRQDAIGDGAPGIVIRGNLLADNAAGGVDSYLTTGGHTIEQNTLRNNGTTAPEEFGIRIMGNSGSSIVKNIFDANNGPSILVVSDRASVPYPASNANLISQNHFVVDSAGIAIDLLDAGSPDAEHETGDGITLNDGATDANAGNLSLDFPVIDSVSLGANLTVAGYSRPGVTIEFYEAVGAVNDQNTGGTAHGEGIRFLFSAAEGSAADTDATTGSYASPDYGSDPAASRFRFTVPVPAGLTTDDAISAIAIDGSNNTSEFGPNAGTFAKVTGTVYEDINGDSGLGDAVAATGVRVRLYTDVNDDGIVDAGDAFVDETTTNASGVYTFTVDRGATGDRYLVAVDSKTVPPDGGFNGGFGQGDVWAEQTYGDDPATPAVDLGPRVGGATAGVSDDVDPALTAPASNAYQHLGRVNLGLGPGTGIDFAFSFQSISHAGDADDDAGANRTAQGSLRQLIQNANAIVGNPTLGVPTDTYVLSMAGADDISERGDLDITDSVTISGAGASSCTIDANGLDRVFDVRSGVVAISAVTIRGGNISNKGGGIRNVANLTLSDSIVASNNAIEGGGIYEEGIGATLVLDNVTLLLNTADKGAGIRIVTDGASATLTDVTLDRNVATGQGGGMSVEQADASLNGVTFVDNDADAGAGLWTKAPTCDVDLTNVTFSGNNSTGEGGGIWAEGNSLTLNNVTIAGNTAFVKGGGIRPKAGTVTLSNTIIAGNTPDNCERAVSSGGGNVESPGNSCALTDPTDQSGVSVADMNIGPLANNGGPTKTHALITGSFAVDAGIGCPPPATDQRGVARPDGAACDSGAFEGALPLALISGSVYHDVNANSSFDAGEFGIGDVWVKLVSGGSVVQVVAADPDTGAYTLTGVADGNYDVIVDDNNDLADATPTAPVNWVFQSPAGGLLSVIVSGADITGQNFGLTFSFDLAADCACGYEDGLLTQVPITVDGDMSDWATVFTDGDNNACDATDDTDRDHPVQSTGRNLLRTAVTWDATYFSMWTQRIGSSNNTQNFIYYADTNVDGIQQNGEPVVVAKWQGNTGAVTLELYTYNDLGSGGDPVLDSNGFADGYSMPGDLVFVKTLTMPDGAGQGSTSGSTDGTQMEWTIEWAELGVPAGAAIGWHVSSTNSNPAAAGLGAQIDDNLGGCGGQCTGSNQFAGIAAMPIAAGGGGTVYAAHTFTNTGNGPDLFDLTWFSSGDFAPVSVTFYEDMGTIGEYDPGVDVLLTDTDADTDPDTGNLAAGESFELLIAIELPGPPAAGNSVVTTVATSNFLPGCGGTVTPVQGSVNDPLFLALDSFKRAFQLDGTPIADLATVPTGLLVKFLIYVTNYGGAVSDISLQDVLDPAFVYQASTMKVDNTLAASAVCPGAVCNEATIFSQVDGFGTPVGDGDAVTAPIDADEASYDTATTTLDLGDQNNANNAQLDLAADSVWALVYTVRVQ